MKDGHHIRASATTTVRVRYLTVLIDGVEAPQDTLRNWGLRRLLRLSDWSGRRDLNPGPLAPQTVLQVTLNGLDSSACIFKHLAEPVEPC